MKIIFSTVLRASTTTINVEGEWSETEVIIREPCKENENERNQVTRALQSAPHSTRGVQTCDHSATWAAA